MFIIKRTNPYNPSVGVNVYNAFGQYTYYPGAPNPLPPYVADFIGNGAYYFRDIALGEVYGFLHNSLLKTNYWTLYNVYWNPSGDGQMYLIYLSPYNQPRMKCLHFLNKESILKAFSVLFSNKFLDLIKNLKIDIGLLR